MVPVALAALAALLFAASGIYYWLCHPLMIYPDQGLYLHMAKLLLQGKIPYVQMFDNNPPLAIYIQTWPILVAATLHIPEPLAFALYIWSLILIACTASGIMLCRSNNRGSIYCGLVVIIAFVYFNQKQVLDFGQREHIFTILYFPFLILRYLRWQGLKVDRWLAVVVGIMAGIGIGLKHYFLLVALAPEIVWAIERRDFKPLFKIETLTLAATLAIYLLHFLFLPRSELDNFFGFIVPIYKAGYQYYTTSLSYNLNTFWREDFYYMALTTLGALILARRSALVMPLQAFSLMSALIFILAGQVWSYHVLPIRLANDLALLLQAALFLDYLPAALKNKKSSHLILAFLVLVGSAAEAFRHCAETNYDVKSAEEFFLPSLGYSGLCPAIDIDKFSLFVLDHTSKDDSLIFISSSMAPGYPVYLQTDRKPGSRFLHAMILPVLQFIIDKPELADKAKYRQDLNQLLLWYGQDIADNRPKYIFVQFPYIAGILDQHGFFQKQMADYTLFQTIDDTKIYVRNR